MHVCMHKTKKKSGQISGSSSLKDVVLLLSLSLPLALTSSSSVGLEVSLNDSSECSSSDSIWKVTGFGKAHTLTTSIKDFPSKINYPLVWKLCGRQSMEYLGSFLLSEKEKPCSSLSVSLVS